MKTPRICFAGPWSVLPAVGRLLATGSLVFAVHSSLQAADATWANVGSDLATGTNWSPTTAPGVSGSTDATNADVATFSGASVVNPYLTSSYTLGKLTFASDAGDYTISGDPGAVLRLNGFGTSSGKTLIEGLSASSLTINTDMILGGSAATGGTITTAGGSTLNFNGKLSEGKTALPLLFRGSGANAVIALNNTANDFTGQVTIGRDSVSGLTLKVASVGMAGAASSLGTNGTVLFYVGTPNSSNTVTLNYTGAGETSDKNFVVGLVASTRTGIRVIDTTGATGALVLTGDISATSVTAGQRAVVRLTGDADLGDTVSGAILDDGSTGGTLHLNKTGSGTWTLAGLAAHHGDTTVDAGTFTVADNGTLTVYLQDAVAGVGAANTTTVASGASLNFDGQLKLDLSGLGTPSDGDSWSLIGGAGSITYGDTFSVASVGLTFSQSGGVWTSNDGSWSFAESTGALTYALVNVPEPSTYGILVGALALAWSSSRRRRR